MPKMVLRGRGGGGQWIIGADRKHLFILFYDTYQIQRFRRQIKFYFVQVAEAETLTVRSDLKLALKRIEDLQAALAGEMDSDNSDENSDRSVILWEML